MSDEFDQAGLILIARFLRFPYEKLSNSLDQIQPEYGDEQADAGRDG